MPRDNRDIYSFLYLNPDITQGAGGDGSFKFIGGQSYGASFSLDGQRTNGGIFGEPTRANLRWKPSVNWSCSRTTSQPNMPASQTSA